MTLPPVERPPEAPRHKPDLDRRYGEIGISAVAAALRSACDESKNERAADAPEKRPGGRAA